MVINTNMNALNSLRNLNSNVDKAGKSMEKLSSGYRINRAGDDAAGLAISEKMRGQIRGLDQASRNAQDSISLIQTAEGALNETHSILQRMRELAVQASNDTNTSTDRTAISDEIKQLTDEIDRIANTTEFNTQKLLNGDKKGLVTAQNAQYNLQNNAAANLTLNNTLGSTLGTDIGDSFTVTITRVNESTAFDANDFNVAVVGGNTAGFSISAYNSMSYTDSGATTVAFGFDTGDLSDLKAGESITISVAAKVDGSTNVSNGLEMQIGANSGQSIMVGINDMKAKALGVRDSSNNALDVSDAKHATAAITQINNAIEKVSAERSKLGAIQNRLEHTINNLGAASENLTASESRIRDVDMAKEMSNYSKENILAQAAQAMLAQANQQPQQVLQLLR